MSVINIPSHSYGESPKRRSPLLIIALIALGVPFACCLGILGIMFFPRGHEVVLSNPASSPIRVQVDYVFPKGVDRRMRYFLVIESAAGQRAEWMYLGELAERGTFSEFPGIQVSSRRPLKVFVEADGPARKKERCSNVVEVP